MSQVQSTVLTEEEHDSPLQHRVRENAHRSVPPLRLQMQAKESTETAPEIAALSLKTSNYPEANCLENCNSVLEVVTQMKR